MEIKSKTAVSVLPSSIEVLAKKRTGGRVNLRGIEYQLLYGIYKALTILSSDSTCHQIRLEGIEDVDVLHKLEVDNQNLYQLKHTSRPLVSSKIWDLGVFQNFAEAHLLNPQATFTIVTNNAITDPKLASIFDGSASEQVYSYWENRFEQFRQESRTSDWNWQQFDLHNFLSSIKIEIVEASTLRSAIEKLIIQYFTLTNSTYSVYLNALFLHFFLSSQVGGTIDRMGLLRIGQEVRDQQSMGTINPAIQLRQIEPVNFAVKTDKDYTAYFDGQPAQPVHIAAGLPAPRPKLEKQILEHLEYFDASVIKASSGQGKSTLAWRVAQTMHEQGRQIYQLHNSANAEAVGGLVEFLETRVLIGEAPVVIIDGLSARHAEWATLADRLLDQPVQFIVTTREEDWVRFGREAYRVRTGKLIKLYFSQAEAKQLYDELKRRQRIHPLCGHWQAAWEKVHQRGLLMEYVYLLTRGEMLQQRLAAQLSQLNGERDGAVKLTILRLVATADDIGIPLQTLRLRQHVNEQYNSQGDLGELLRQLEEEYYVQFDRQYVQGLHPVRSNHLKAILHQYVPLSETFLTLAKLIEPSALLMLGKAIPKQIDQDEQIVFLKSLVESLRAVAPNELSKLLLGIYQGEVNVHHKKHSALCNSVFMNGGYELFAMLTIPFPHKNANSDLLSSLAEWTGNPDNHVLKAVPELPELPIQQTMLRQIVPEIHRYLLQQKVPIGQMGELMNWFALFDLRVSMPEDKEILSCLETYEKEAFYQLGLGLSTICSEMFDDFINRNIDLIIHWLKRNTNTLSIEPDGDRVLIEYLLTEDLTEKANAESVKRIEIIRAWLPMFQAYETNALMFPFPNEEIIAFTKQNAYKILSPEVIFTPFKVSLNCSWRDSLLEPYRADSLYKWQAAHIELREQAFDCARAGYSLLEQILKGNARARSFDKAFQNWERISDTFLDTDKKHPIFPALEVNPSKTGNNLKLLYSSIEDWTSWIRNFYQKFASLLPVDKVDTRHFILMSLRQAEFHLPKMQEAFNLIGKQTLVYFDTTELVKQENYWYGRLRRASEYYGEHVMDSSFKRINEISTTVADYWENRESSRYHKLLASLDRFSSLTGYSIYKPSQLTEEEFTTHAVVGIEGLTRRELENDFERLAFNLVSVGLTDVDFLAVLICKEKKVTSGFQFKRDFFDKAAKLIDGGEEELSPSDFLIPIIPDEDTIKTLPQVTLALPESPSIGKPVGDLYQTLWKLVETVKHSKVKIEADESWKQQQISNYRNQATSYLKEIERGEYADIADITKKTYHDVLANPSDWTGRLLAERLLETLNLLLED
ncbi:hypothetical protein [Salmonirosea aquatica]|uniref:Uncharacterized protein n=1 Tax=Salmonirosea aquatica TaxID=2654236 RepID=A0A7C9F676_9BACT|nr:hypothetical protein [Cytophagaceae bacterium SJW1-29]